METRNLTNQALAELSGKALGDVQLLVGKLGLKDVAVAVGVAPAALDQAVQEKVEARVDAAASDGQIGKEQAASLLQRLTGSNG